MAACHRRRSATGQATFSLLARELPDDGGFLAAAGLAHCLRFLEGFSFTRMISATAPDPGGTATDHGHPGSHAARASRHAAAARPQAAMSCPGCGCRPAQSW